MKPKYSLGVDIGSLLTTSSSSSSRGLPSSDAWFFKIGVPIINNFQLGGDLLIKRSSYSGGGSYDSVKYDEDETSFTFGAAGFLQFKALKAGLAIQSSSYEVKVDYEDTIVDYSIESSSLNLSPFIGAEFLFSNGALSLEARNYFNLYFVDDPDNDYEGTATSQALYLKFYIF